MKMFFNGATPTGGKVKKFNERQVLSAKKWDENHIAAIKNYFAHCREAGLDQVIEATDIDDLISEVERIYSNTVALMIAQEFLALVDSTGLEPQVVAGILLDIMGQIREKAINLAMNQLKNGIDSLSTEEREKFMSMLKQLGFDLPD